MTVMLPTVGCSVTGVRQVSGSQSSSQTMAVHSPKNTNAIGTNSYPSWQSQQGGQRMDRPRRLKPVLSPSGAGAHWQGSVRESCTLFVCAAAALGDKEDFSLQRCQSSTFHQNRFLKRRLADFCKGLFNKDVCLSVSHLLRCEQCMCVSVSHSCE